MEKEFIKMFYDLYNHAVAVFLLRTVTGILFFFQGYDKIFNVKIENVVRTFNEPLKNFRIPVFLYRPFITISSYIELLGGLLLFFGLFKYPALYILSADMIAVAFIFSSVKAMWDMQFYFPRILFIVILLVIPPVTDIFSLDYFTGIGIK